MTVEVGVMQLPVTEDPDPVREYLNGTHASGGLWTALTRASNHDHSGGLNGVQLGATSIPDGSITSAKLDPSVLLPYALVDGSKPFTGQVTMEADAIVRDTVYFGQQGSALPADATLARTGPGALRADSHLGVGVNPAAWQTGIGAIDIGGIGGGSWYAYPGFTALTVNAYYDNGFKAAANAPGRVLLLDGAGGLRFETAPAVAVGATQTYTTRLSVAPTGTLTLTPDAGVDALAANGPVLAAAAAVLTGFRTSSSGNALEFLFGNPATKVVGRLNGLGTLTLTPDAGQAALTSPGETRIASGSTIFLQPASGHIWPHTDSTYYLGYSSNRFFQIWASSGIVSSSSRTVKEGITPLDPAACYQAAKDVRWYEFAYLPPAYTEPEPPPDIAYDAADDNDTKAEKKALRDEAEAQAKAAHLKMVAETAPARHQRGFVFPAGDAKDEAGGTLPPVPDLFGLSDRESTTPQADLATLGAALQHLIMKVEALEAAQV